MPFYLSRLQKRRLLNCRSLVCLRSFSQHRKFGRGLAASPGVSAGEKRPFYMNGILVIVTGVVILYLVISGKLDCFLKAVQACGAANGGGSPTNTASPT